MEALLQLAANGRQCSLSSTNVTATEQESDEGIVSDQSNEFEENKKVSPAISELRPGPRPDDLRQPAGVLTLSGSQADRDTVLLVNLSRVLPSVLLHLSLT